MVHSLWTLTHVLCTLSLLASTTCQSGLIIAPNKCLVATDLEYIDTIDDKLSLITVARTVVPSLLATIAHVRATSRLHAEIDQVRRVRHTRFGGTRSQYR